MPHSWSASFSDVPDADQAAEQVTGQIADDWPAESREQAETAVGLLRLLIDSGGLGEGPYQGGVSGQSTEAHTGVSSVGGNDGVTVTVTAVRPDPSVKVDPDTGEPLSEADRIAELEQQVEELRGKLAKS